MQKIKFSGVRAPMSSSSKLMDCEKDFTLDEPTLHLSKIAGDYAKLSTLLYVAII
jgi:hypothetical protein